jgi:hypothetical protein
MTLRLIDFTYRILTNLLLSLSVGTCMMADRMYNPPLQDRTHGRCHMSWRTLVLNNTSRSRYTTRHSSYPHHKRLAYRGTHSYLGMLWERPQFSKNILSRLTTIPFHLSKTPLFNSSPKFTWFFLQPSMRQMDIYSEPFHRRRGISPNSRTRSSSISFPYTW